MSSKILDNPVGKIYRSPAGTRYILAQTENNRYAMISLDDGNRYSDPANIEEALEDFVLDEEDERRGSGSIENLIEISSIVRCSDCDKYRVCVIEIDAVEVRTNREDVLAEGYESAVGKVLASNCSLYRRRSELKERITLR